MTEKRWSFNGGVIVGTDICEEGIPHTNRSIVTHLNMYERKIRELEEENEQLKKENIGLKTLKVGIICDNCSEMLKKENEQLKQELAEIKEICNKNRIPNHLTAHIPFNCEHRHSCLENHSENAVSMGKSKIAKEILKLIDGDVE